MTSNPSTKHWPHSWKFEMEQKVTPPISIYFLNSSKKFLLLNFLIEISLKTFSFFLILASHKNFVIVFLWWWTKQKTQQLNVMHIRPFKMYKKISYLSSISLCSISYDCEIESQNKKEKEIERRNVWILKSFKICQQNISWKNLSLTPSKNKEKQEFRWLCR